MAGGWPELGASHPEPWSAGLQAREGRPEGIKAAAERAWGLLTVTGQRRRRPKKSWGELTQGREQRDPSEEPRRPWEEKAAAVGRACSPAAEREPRPGLGESWCPKAPSQRAARAGRPRGWGRQSAGSSPEGTQHPYLEQGAGPLMCSSVQKALFEEEDRVKKLQQKVATLEKRNKQLRDRVKKVKRSLRQARKNNRHMEQMNRKLSEKLSSAGQILHINSLKQENSHATYLKV